MIKHVYVNVLFEDAATTASTAPADRTSDDATLMVLCAAPQTLSALVAHVCRIFPYVFNPRTRIISGPKALKNKGWRIAVFGGTGGQCRLSAASYHKAMRDATAAEGGLTVRCTPPSYNWAAAAARLSAE